MSVSAEERTRQRALFESYASEHDTAVRDELVDAHLRLAHHLAHRFVNRGVPFDDLVQVASLALVKAVERFDPSRGLEFSTFATPTIVGELKRHFRDKGWAIRVPRRIQELHGRLNVLVGELTHELGRSPSIAELARAARTSEEEVLEAMEASRAYRASSLDALTAADGGDERGLVPPEVDVLFRSVENRLLVDRLLSALDPRDRLMLRMRYFDEMTQGDIAERLGISQMHVSRLLRRSLDQLRLSLQPEDEGDTP